PRNAVIDCTAKRTDKDPAIAAFEGVIGLETRRPVASMSRNRTFAGEDRQRGAVSLSDRFILRDIDNLAPTGLLDLPQPHHCRRPTRERGHIVGGIGLSALRRTGWVACQVHHPTVRLRDRIITRSPEVLLLAVLTIGADPYDHQTRIDRERQLVGDAVAFARTGRRRLHPDVRDLP